MIYLNVKKKLSGADGPFELNLNMEIQSGELVALYGPTGAGKSSILRMIAGLLDPDTGAIQWNNTSWYDSQKKINIAPQKRNIAMVFQDYSLFPNMTVRENLQFAMGKGDNISIVDELLCVVELNNLAHKKPGLLSGGQKQRVALARALIRKPKLLILDEPLSALDTNMRSKLQDYILYFHKQFSLTTIVVTHNYADLISLAERVFVLENGRIAKICEPKDLLDK